MLEDLGRLGVRRGHLLMVHASLRKIGLVHTDFGEGGADCYLAPGRHRAGRVGGTDSALIGAADIIAFGARRMEEKFAGGSD